MDDSQHIKIFHIIHSGTSYAGLFHSIMGNIWITLIKGCDLMVSVNYRFPIAYPDWAIGGHAFIKRLKGNVFFDYGRFGVTSFPFTEQCTNASSLGFELGIDFRAFRLLEIDLGMRYSYLLNDDFINGSRHQFDFFVVSISE